MHLCSRSRQSECSLVNIVVCLENVERHWSIDAIPSIILLGSPLAVAKAAATLPGVHTKHDIIQNINRQEQLKDRTTYILKKAHVAYISIHTHKLSGSNRGEALCREVLLYLFFETRFAVYLSNMRWKGVPCNNGSI